MKNFALPVSLALSALFLPTPAAAQQCAGTQDFTGDYMMVTSRLVYIPQAVTPPGTTAVVTLTTATLVTNAVKDKVPAAVAGRLFADGAGNLIEISGATTGPFGTYSVGSDCALTVNVLQSGKPAATFKGYLQDRGTSASLNESSGVEMEISRPFLAGGCGNASLSGPVVLDGFGLTMAPAEMPPASGGSPPPPAAGPLNTPFWLLERVFADGSGAFTTDVLVGTGTPFTGTYSINADCTGRATIKSGDGKTTQTMQLLLTQAPGLAGGVGRSSLRWVIQGAASAGAGTGK